MRESCRKASICDHRHDLLSHRSVAQLYQGEPCLSRFLHIGLDQHRVVFGHNNRDEIPTNLGGEVVREIFV